MAVTLLGSGQAIVKVVYTEKKDTFVGTSVQTGSGYYIDVTGMSATITPSSSTNRILIVVNLYMGPTTAASGYQQSMRIRRNGTYPILGTSEGGRPTTSGRLNMYATNTHFMANLTGYYIDSPNSTSAQTYQIEVGGYTGSPVMYVNRTEGFQVLANDYDTIPVSTLTLMEISG